MLQGAAPGSTVRLPAGEHWVAVDGSGVVLEIPSGVTLDARGATLRLIPNALQSYAMVLMSGQNSALIGGTLVGDRDQHLDDKGEWGMCVSIRGASDVTIRDTKALRCYGDGIYVGTSTDGRKEPARRITIEGVEAAHNLRNNISIVAVDGFRLANVHAHHAKGKRPEAGLDLEPNAGDQVVNGEIVNLLSENNGQWGIVFAGKRGPIKRITMDGITVRDNGFAGVWFRGASEIKAGSITSTGSGMEGLAFQESSSIEVRRYSGTGNGRDNRNRAGIRYDNSRDIVVNETP